MFWRGNDSCAFREIAVVGVVQRVLDVVADQHFDSPLRVFECLQVIRCDAFVVDVLGIGDIVEVDLGIKVEFFSLLSGTCEEGLRRREEAGTLEMGQCSSTQSSALCHPDHSGRLACDRAF